jgi:RsiW-degrading membrane proteinase PrsW (M82 family)
MMREFGRRLRSRLVRPLRVLAGAAAAVALAVAPLVLGCSPPHLAGTNDAALDYAAADAPGGAPQASPALIAAGAKARLAAAQIPADVDATAEAEAGIQVVADADVAGLVDELLTWRGGVSVYRLDADYVLAPPDTAGIRPMIAKDNDGRVDRWWQGEAASIARAVRQAKLDAGHTVFAEALADGEWRTRVAVVPPIAELGLSQTPLEAIEPALHGRAVALTLSSSARDALALERSRHPGPGERVAVARGDSLLQTMAFDQALASPLLLGFGNDVRAYTRAYRTRQLLSSPVLPTLRRTSARPVAPRWSLAAACAILPFVLSFAWLFFVRRFDRARPEPMWLVTATFALGGVAIVPAAIVEYALAKASPWLDPSFVTLGGQPWALPLAIPVFAVTVGLVEEGAKFLGAWSLARHRREFDEPVDGIIYGCAAALGFAAVENVKYFALGRMSGVVIALRAFMTVPAHLFFGAIWGYAMGARLVSRRTSVALFLGLAALAHGAFDALLSTDGTQLWATLLVLVLAATFFALLRRSLRYGAVASRPSIPAPCDGTRPTEPVPASTLPRTLYRVGSAPAFFGCAAAMILCAFALTVLGTAYELLHHRAGVVFVGLATAMLALFGLAAYGASETMPLDVAIDAWGITFAGARTPWAAVVGAEIDLRGRAGAFVRLETRDGTLRMGPTTPETARRIAEACSGQFA